MSAAGRATGKQLLGAAAATSGEASLRVPLLLLLLLVSEL